MFSATSMLSKKQLIGWSRYGRFRPDRFDRRKINRRLKQYAQGIEEWRWE
jgi:hypothetical protein